MESIEKMSVKFMIRILVFVLIKVTTGLSSKINVSESNYRLGNFMFAVRPTQYRGICGFNT